MRLLKEKDLQTYQHSLRVGELCKRMAVYLHLNEKQTRQLVQGSCLHDIGKVGIPDEILNKSSALTAQEWEVMRQHPYIGTKILLEHGDIETEIIEIIHYHHERWNGEGYPCGLKENKIPVFARICAIIDTFDCMVSDRPYRKGLSFAEAEQELLIHSGTQFDSYYVDAFLNLFHTIGVNTLSRKIRQEGDTL
ncbi:HD-GYP domain-containing protein [Paenibacillus sp. N3.4]|uniref:HD-GYP domain-containing protein n=1 Tax=Paenibacillus sp. N3.4 TaxID=2603222 RepID=UPI0011C9581D|nr:HD-GYP domain-containing protein [Paenibacillus sp. N3.4]TXK71792.1 HD-GYP domain-containing protein [Paenibacillus sp. N3.4]